jgi:branched-chain amino acid transport system substrate-binding protein
MTKKVTSCKWEVKGGRLAALLLLAPIVAAWPAGCANKPAAAPPAAGGTASSQPPIVVAEYGSLTGGNSTFGTSTDNGVQLAAKQIDSAGGLNGRPLQVTVQDDSSTADGALNVVSREITQLHPTAVIGEVASTLSIQAAPICNRNQVPMISPSSTNPKVTQLGPYIFRVCFIDPFQGPVAARFAYNNLKARKAAIMRDTTSDYSRGLTDVFTASFQKLGGTVVSTEDYREDDVNFQSQLTRIKGLNPDILYVPGYYGQVGPIAKQAREIGLAVPLLGGDGWDSPKLIEGAGGPGGALEGCYFTDHSSMDDPSPLIQKFVADYKAAYHVQPDSLAALGYDAVGVLGDSIKRAGAPADGDYSSAAYRAKLRDAIAATKDYKGVTGTITLNADRNAVKPAVVLQIKGDAYKYVTTFNP